MQGGGEREMQFAMHDKARSRHLLQEQEAGAGDMLGAHFAIIGLFEVV